MYDTFCLLLFYWVISNAHFYNEHPFVYMSVRDLLLFSRSSEKTNFSSSVFRQISGMISCSPQDNLHRLQLVMRPDDDHESRLQQQEADKLQSYVTKLSEQERQNVYDTGTYLQWSGH